MTEEASTVEGEGEMEIEFVVGDGSQAEAGFGDVLEVGAGVGDVLNGRHDDCFDARCDRPAGFGKVASRRNQRSVMSILP